MSNTFSLISGTNTFLWLTAKLLRFFTFLGVNQIFCKFQCCQHSKICIFMENKPKPCWETYWKGGTAFLYKNLELLIFKIFAGGPKLRMYEFSDSVKNSFCWISGGRVGLMSNIFSFISGTNTFIRLTAKIWGFSPFLGVNQIFSKFQCCQHSKNWILKENKPKPCWETKEL